MMQYILTQAEYDELKRVKEMHFNVMTKRLQELCTKVADEMPVNWGWNGPDPKPWGCIHSKDLEWYCDTCPVSSFCPSDKQWSK
jgi:hypothetical protein